MTLRENGEVRLPLISAIRRSEGAPYDLIDS
jgi:hypothetical protein